MAAEMFEQALTISPAFEEAAFNASATYYNLGKIDSAYNVFRKVNPKNNDANYKHYLSSLLPAFLKQMEDTAEHDLRLRIAAIRNTEGWADNIHYKSLKNSISFVKQMMLDINYIIREEEKGNL